MSDDASSSTTSPAVAVDDDLPLNFFLEDDDHQVESEQEGGGSEDSNDNGGSNSTAESFSSMNLLAKSEESSNHIDDVCNVPLSTTDGVSPASLETTIPHRGSLRRILNPSSFHVSTTPTPSIGGLSNQSSWPMYAINVEIDGGSQSQYQIIFDRKQYEFYTRLFAILDTECQSVIGPDCIREFLSLHCPVLRRRDDAIFALQSAEEGSERGRRGLLSPTFDEIWRSTFHSDTRSASSEASTSSIQRIGIEGWMVFCRLLALAHHQEFQRRFASRHLQQMMRHKHGGGATRMNANEVVVVVDNPPPGPPALISIRALMDVEQERVTSHSDARIQGWPFCPLPIPELDLVHSLSSNTPRMRQRGTVYIEPFSSSLEDFVLRFHHNNDFRTVVRRSYSDFEWLHLILKLHKRPGQGHLCGRILPPFPSKQGKFQQQHYMLSKETLRAGTSHQHSQKDISERAIEAAKSGMGMITSVAKSVWSGYISGSTPTSSPSSSLTKSKTLSLQMRSGSVVKEEDVPAIVAHGIERYLNYLLENNALSTSFPLNAILQASQSGLESAKQTLHGHTKQKKRQKSKLVAATSRGGPHSAASIFSALLSKTSTSLSRHQDNDDTPWLRAAAQVAMALQFHGILETAGRESSSAKIQHASLPKFGNRPSGSWDEEETGSAKRAGTNNGGESSESNSPKSESNFEAGVINVESELADEEDSGGYEMLPSPGPSEEHRVLNAGSVATGRFGDVKSQQTTYRFVYETASEQTDEIHDRKDAVLGSIRVDSGIEKLRGIIRSINHTLGKLYQSSAAIQSAQGERNIILASLLRDVDSWGDSGGEVISQRALVTGVAALEAFNSAIEESNRAMTDDLLWQSTLATSALTAVTEVRDAVRASLTATRAKSAAFIAAEKAKKAYESCDQSSSKEKIQQTQSEASAAQSHAIHATVVEYEANIAKKRSAVSLAQDVKLWNVHRKRELLRTCIQVAKTQHEAYKKAADAWESLRDGLIDPSSCPFAKDDADMLTNPMNISQVYTAPITASYANTQEILAPENLDTSRLLESWGRQDFSSEFDVKDSTPVSSVADARVTDASSLKESQLSSSEKMKESADNIYFIAPPNMSHLDEDYFSFHQHITAEESSDNDENKDNALTSSAHESFHSGLDDHYEERPNCETMSMSMQSLIDGIMAWGEEGDQKNEDDYQNDDQQNSVLLG